jgi:fucose 4-O-acetylase-like acetyltransferase
MPSETASVRDRGLRNPYVDLLRSVAIVAVVLGHWLATGVVVRDGRDVGVDALGVVSWGPWATLLLQVIPVFFLVGGYANAASWSRHRAAGQPWQDWVSSRVRRLLLPTCGYLAFVAALVLVGRVFGADPGELAEAGWALSLHLWFLAAYLIVLLAAPALYAAHLRWGLRAPATMALSAVVIDTGVVAFHWPLVGWANYLLVWGCFHQVGFSWDDGRLSGRRPGLILASAAVVILVALIWWGPYPVSMVGVPGARVQNPSPPSTALLAFGLAQCGVAIALEPTTRRWLDRHRRARWAADVGGALTMPVYLWHMVPVALVVAGGYLSIVGDPAVGNGTWWGERAVWITVLGLVLAALLFALAQLTRLARARLVGHLGRHPAGDGRVARTVRRPAPSRTTALLVTGIAAASVGIAQLAVRGFAPDGSLGPIPLVEVALGLALVGGADQRSSTRPDPARSPTRR